MSSPTRSDKYHANKHSNVTTYYLEMLRRDALRPGRAFAGVDVIKVHPASPELNRSLYETVGAEWHWVDRLVWTPEEWFSWVNRDALQTWIAWVGGAQAGYFELELQGKRSVEIAFFGLLPGFIGQGLGGHLLTVAIRQAWNMKSERVWVHTCTLDHPNALANYKARGFQVFREETHTLDSLGPGPKEIRKTRS